EPRQILLCGLTRRESGDPASPVRAADQHAAIARNIEELHRHRQAREKAMTAGEGDCVEAVVASLTRVEPDLITGRRPRQVDELAGPSAGKHRLLPARVQRADRPVASESRRTFGE